MIGGDKIQLAKELALVQTLEIGKRSRFTSMLACSICTHKRISPEGLGTITTGETQELGPLTFSKMSSSTSPSSLVLSLSGKWEGTCLIGFTTGCTSGSIGTFSWKSFSLPIPSQHLGNFPKILASPFAPSVETSYEFT